MVRPPVPLRGSDYLALRARKTAWTESNRVGDHVTMVYNKDVRGGSISTSTKEWQNPNFIHKVLNEYSDVMGIGKQELIDILWRDGPDAPPLMPAVPQHNTPLGPSTTDCLAQPKKRTNNQQTNRRLCQKMLSNFFTSANQSTNPFSKPIRVKL